MWKHFEEFKMASKMIVKMKFKLTLDYIIPVTLLIEKKTENLMVYSRDMLVCHSTDISKHMLVQHIEYTM